MKIGIIGAGNIGTRLARLATQAGIDVVLANSRGPHTLDDLVAELGPHATAGTLDEAADHDLVVLAVPLGAALQMSPGLLAGTVVLDTTNYYPFRDGRITELDAGELTTSEAVQRHFPQARVAKAFANILAHHVPQLARPQGAPDRSALPVAGDDDAAKGQVRALVERLGFDTLDAGAAADAWRFEPESAGYTPIYLAAPLRPGDDIMTAPGAPTGRDAVASALASAQRVDVAARQF